MDCSMPGFTALTISQSLPKFMSIELVIWFNHLILCCPLLLFAFNFSQHQNLFKWVGSSHQVGKGLELPHQSLQWISRVDFLWDWLVWSPCCPRDSRESSPAPHFESINSSVLSHLYGPTFTSMHDYWKSYYWKTSTHGWPCAVQTCIVQRSSVFRAGQSPPLTEYFHHPKKAPHPASAAHHQHPCSRPHHRALANADLLSVPLHLSVLEVSCKWNHTVCDFLTPDASCSLFWLVFFFCIFFYIWLMITKCFIESSFLLSLIVIKYFLGPFFSSVIFLS